MYRSLSNFFKKFMLEYNEDLRCVERKLISNRDKEYVMVIMFDSNLYTPNI